MYLKFDNQRIIVYSFFSTFLFSHFLYDIYLNYITSIRSKYFFFGSIIFLFVFSSIFTIDVFTRSIFIRLHRYRFTKSFYDDFSMFGKFR